MEKQDGGGGRAFCCVDVGEYNRSFAALSSIRDFAYLISDLALVRSRSTQPRLTQPTIYRIELDSSGQALLTSHPSFLLAERRSGTVLF